MNSGFLKNLLRPFRAWYVRQRELPEWKKNGCPDPPPGIVKQKTIKNLAKQYRIHHLVETGTYQGQMVNACRKQFAQITSIELNQTLYENAKSRFAHAPNITILYGNSAALLPAIMDNLTAPALFWLDGHYSGEGTSKVGDLGDDPEVYTPIREELKLILAHPIRNHVILIDDARGFVGQHGYPDMGELREIIASCGADYEMSIENDAISLLPRTLSHAQSL